MNNFLVKILTGFFLFTALLSFSNLAGAQEESTETDSYRSFNLNAITYNPDSELAKAAKEETGNPIGAFVVKIINFFILISGSVSFLGLVVGGFFILVSAGNDARHTKGKEIITFSITGLVISLSAYFIISFVQYLLFGVQ